MELNHKTINIAMDSINKNIYKNKTKISKTSSENKNDFVFIYF